MLFLNDDSYLSKNTSGLLTMMVSFSAFVDFGVSDDYCCDVARSDFAWSSSASPVIGACPN